MEVGTFEGWSLGLVEGLAELTGFVDGALEGLPTGTFVGLMGLVDGCLLGLPVGVVVGLPVTGLATGDLVGLSVTGLAVGDFAGLPVTGPPTAVQVPPTQFPLQHSAST